MKKKIIMNDRNYFIYTDEGLIFKEAIKLMLKKK